MVSDATGTITIKVGSPTPPETPWWLIGLAGGLGIATIAVVNYPDKGKGKKKKRRR